MYILSVGVYDAISHFNYGEKATLDVLKLLNVEPDMFTTIICDSEPGMFTTIICDTVNRERKRSAVYRPTESAKKNIEQEGTSYEDGCF